MTRISILLFFLLVCFATAMQAQAPAPKPNPEVKKLHAVLGHWTFEGEQKPGPLGPAGKLTGERTCQMILGGFFVQCRYTSKTPTGEVRILEVRGYDPVNKNFFGEQYSDNGARTSSVLTITGNTWTLAGKLVTAGKQYQVKGTFELAPDLASAAFKSEISVDGETWTPFRESRYTKVPPAAKK
jgi:hypothetical protein